MSTHPQKINELLARLTIPITDDNEAAGEIAAIALGQLGEEAWPAIEQLATSHEVDQRFWAVRSLWANGTPTACEHLIGLLRDADDMICSVAALALGELKHEAAIPHLLNLMLQQASPLGHHAADALSKIGSPAAPDLITALDDERSWVRIRAAKALIPIESKAAIRALIHHLDYDESYLVRHYADEALKRMGVGQMIYFK